MEKKRVPNEEEIAEASGLPLRKVMAVLEANENPISLDQKTKFNVKLSVSRSPVSFRVNISFIGLKLSISGVAAFVALIHVRWYHGNHCTTFRSAVDLHHGNHYLFI